MKEATLKQAGKIIDRDEFRKLLGITASNTYSITVNYDRSIEDAVMAGNYDWKNSDINSKNFSTKKSGISGIAEVDVELVHFNREMSTEEALKELDKRGQRPAEFHELLALGEKYPDLQREFPVIALGSVWQRPFGSRLCPYLSGNGAGRDLFLFWFDRRWNDNCRFLAAVCK